MLYLIDKVNVLLTYEQCCGSMAFCCGSGSAVPCLWLMDPDPFIFVINLQDANKKQIFLKVFCLLLFECTFTSFFEDKRSNRSHRTVGNSRNKVFLTIFAWWLMKKGSGSIHRKRRSGSRRPKNIWIRRITIGIRIRNTDYEAPFYIHAFHWGTINEFKEISVYVARICTENCE